MFSNLLAKVIKGKTLLEQSCHGHYLSFTFNKGEQNSNEKCQHSALLLWQKQWTQLKDSVNESIMLCPSLRKTQQQWNTRE